MSKIVSIIDGLPIEFEKEQENIYKSLDLWVSAVKSKKLRGFAVIGIIEDKELIYQYDKIYPISNFELCTSIEILKHDIISDALK